MFPISVPSHSHVQDYFIYEDGRCQRLGKVPRFSQSHCVGDLVKCSLVAGCGSVSHTKPHVVCFGYSMHQRLRVAHFYSLVQLVGDTVKLCLVMVSSFHIHHKQLVRQIKCIRCLVQSVLFLSVMSRRHCKELPSEVSSLRTFSRFLGTPERLV